MKVSERLEGNRYPGRGIVVGFTPSGKAAVAYFIMGRSANSRNRVLELDGGELFTKPADDSKVEDPSLIIYRALGVKGNALVVTNGDQTDTVLNAMTGAEEGVIYEAAGEGDGNADCELGENFSIAMSEVVFEEALCEREYEPDAPNYTPRISGIVDLKEKRYELSILKRNEELISEDDIEEGIEASDCEREFFEYEKKDGAGHLIHTYEGDGNPLPTFVGEPREVSINDDLSEFTDEIWQSLDEDNKIALYTRFVDLETLEYEERLVNKYERI